MRRVGLAVLSLTGLSVGVWALFMPGSFHDGFPIAGRGWVSALGPYNEHLTRDVGALNLALGVLLAAAAIRQERGLVIASLAAWLVYAVPHLVFHLAEPGDLRAPDYLANGISLALAVLLPVALLLLELKRRAPADGPSNPQGKG